MPYLSFYFYFFVLHSLVPFIQILWTSLPSRESVRLDWRKRASSDVDKTGKSDKKMSRLRLTYVFCIFFKCLWLWRNLAQKICCRREKEFKKDHVEGRNKTVRLVLTHCVKHSRVGCCGFVIQQGTREKSWWWKHDGEGELKTVKPNPRRENLIY